MHKRQTSASSKEKLRQLDMDLSTPNLRIPTSVNPGPQIRAPSNGRSISKNERDLLRELQNLQKYCLKVEQKYEKVVAELKRSRGAVVRREKEQNTAVSNIEYLREANQEMAKRESHYTDYIGRLEQKLVEQAKLID